MTFVPDGGGDPLYLQFQKVHPEAPQVCWLVPPRKVYLCALLAIPASRACLSTRPLLLHFARWPTEVSR